MNARIFLFGAGLMTVSFLCGIAYAVRFIEG
jgi:hypothetical protein